MLDWLPHLDRDGYHLLPAVFSAEQMLHVIHSLECALSASNESAILDREGTVYAARNILALWPAVIDLWRTSLRDILGEALGLVRVLYFDKPPGQTWALPWHKDMTIAVRDNRLPSTLFSKPTRKAGIPHVQAPLAVLENMLTARIHLDPADEDNGALKVLPGSHRTGATLRLDGSPQLIQADAGDVLLMRPLLAHASGRSLADTVRHRRILHLEFSATPELPDGYAWHDFVPDT